jgi:hypothetical protein
MDQVLDVSHASFVRTVAAYCVARLVEPSHYWRHRAPLALRLAKVKRRRSLEDSAVRRRCDWFGRRYHLGN